MRALNFASVPIVVFVIAMAVNFVGCGDDSDRRSEPSSPAAERAKAERENVVYRGARLMEFDEEAPASVIERVSARRCGTAGFDIAVAVDTGYGFGRILVTCRGQQAR